MSKKRPAWRPRLRLLRKETGSYWYVLWTCDRAELDWGSPIPTFHPNDVPFMIRNSQAARAAQAFAARLNQQRSLAY